MEEYLNMSKEDLLKRVWRADLQLRRLFVVSATVPEARQRAFQYLNRLDRLLFNVYSTGKFVGMHPLEKNIAKECLRVLKNVFRTENERITKFSAFKQLFRLAKNPQRGLRLVSAGFLAEFLFLLKGIHGTSGVLSKKVPAFLELSGRVAARERSRELDKYANSVLSYFRRYGCGLEEKVIEKRDWLKHRILKHFSATEPEWRDYKWHLRHVITSLNELKKLVPVTKAEEEGLRLAEKHKVAFQITPYYLSLFTKDLRPRFGRCIRAQVIPSAEYVRQVVESRNQGRSMDFMGESSTSPIDCITRRYPLILILKPYNSCPQICVYCQRNWEIKPIKEAEITKSKVLDALRWIAKNKHITEVLVTGGDPLTLNNDYIGWLLEELSNIPHIQRIRIGTRTLVTVPFRINDGFLDILRRYHNIGRNEICIVTHVEHPTEITPELLEAVKRIRMLGISVYNQQVFTYFNSKKFETCALRRWLKLCGVDPYYSFNTKGKLETKDFRVPIARIEQERKEEARLLPGLERTDEPVFNVPRLGKVHLRAWQDHEPIMVLPDGSRVYRFYPWDSKLELVDPYDYVDVPIYDYLKRIQRDGDDVNDYKTIWYYF